MKKSTLIVGWKQELEQIESMASSLERVQVILFDDNGLVWVPSQKVNDIEFLTIEQGQFTHRDSSLKAPSELALWLYEKPSFDTIYFSRYAGLGYFANVLHRTVERCMHWNVHWFGCKSVQQEYTDAKRFLDKEGLLLRHLEKHQEIEKTHLKNERARIDINDVSVIIPFHNRIDYLPLTLTSAAQQGVGLEVVIVNDASSPVERKKLAELLEDPRFSNLDIKVIDSMIPLGASNARNKGAASTNRGYLFFLDDDDILAPSALRLCCDALSRENADVVTVAFSFFEGDGIPDFTNDKGMLIQFHSAKDWSSALLYNCVGGISALYRKATFEQANGFQCGEFAGEEDWQLILKLSFAGKNIANIPLPLLWYRNTPFSLSKKMLRYESRQQLCTLYEKVLPEPLAALPEFVTSTQHMQKKSFDEMAMLGWELYPYRECPVYIYGGGELGRNVLTFLKKLEPSINIEFVIDRNAAFIKEIMGYKVVTLDECVFKENATVVIASLSFVDEIAAQLPPSVSHVINLKK
ncbi:glycosyltransferase [Alteromonas sp. 345S023]|uniref:Glycosyltransferase n=1 Tax=Alteromonas profundi TaxID=2696062 RepID=A0A7X5LI97_9ALTE|nr:glycosyltransferase family 2 protein [Alteromonas profundi]NDV89857.1 glycosyltransferase [Alteromonas profundi]